MKYISTLLIIFLLPASVIAKTATYDADTNKLTIPVARVYGNTAQLYKVEATNIGNFAFGNILVTASSSSTSSASDAIYFPDTGRLWLPSVTISNDMQRTYYAINLGLDSATGAFKIIDANITSSNQLYIYFATKVDSSQYFSSIGQKLDADTQYLIRYNPATKQSDILDQNYNPSYASSTIHPYTVGDDFYIREEWSPLEYNGNHTLKKFDPITNKQLFQISVSKPYYFARRCSAIVGNYYYYKSTRDYDIFYGNIGGEFRRLSFSSSSYTSGTGDKLFDYGDSNNCMGDLISDNGKLYDVSYSSDKGTAIFYQRNLTTGVAEFLGGFQMESNHDTIYHAGEYGFAFEDGAAYLIRRRISDDAIMIWKNDLTNAPELIFEKVPEIMVSSRSVDMDNGYISIGRSGVAFVVDTITGANTVYSLGTGGYNVQILVLPQ